jgi:sugar lactone lactonase YvrE
VALDAAGKLLIADYYNNRIRRVDVTTGIITTAAGNGTAGFSGDGGPATSASLAYPGGVAVDAAGNLFIADYNRIRRVDGTTGIITTVAGNGISGFGGDGGPATSASLDRPGGVTIDAAGNLLIADQFNHRIRRVDGTTGIITTVAGNGTPFFNGDGGPATSAALDYPAGVAIDAAGNLLIADRVSDRIRRVDGTTGIITTVAGGGTGTGGASRPTAGFSGDGGPATSASLFNPAGVAVDAAGNLLIADQSNQRIRRVRGL